MLMLQGIPCNILCLLSELMDEKRMSSIEWFVFGNRKEYSNRKILHPSLHKINGATG